MGSLKPCHVLLKQPATGAGNQHKMSLISDKKVPIVGLIYMLIGEDPLGPVENVICAVIQSYCVKFVRDYDEARD